MRLLTEPGVICYDVKSSKYWNFMLYQVELAYNSMINRCTDKYIFEIV